MQKIGSECEDDWSDADYSTVSEDDVDDAEGLHPAIRIIAPSKPIIQTPRRRPMPSDYVNGGGVRVVTLRKTAGEPLVCYHNDAYYWFRHYLFVKKKKKKSVDI